MKRSRPTSSSCRVCGEAFPVTGTRGPVAALCPAHSKRRGRERQPAANAARKNAAKRRKRAAVGKRAAAHTVDQVSQLAAALAVYSNASDAAQWVGLTSADGKPITGAELRRLAARARADHPAIVGGDVRALGERLTATMHLVAQAVVMNRHEIAPRDLPHVLRALAQAREQIAPPTESRHSEISVYVVGADGQPIAIDEDGA